MVAILEFLYFVIHFVLNFMIWIVIAYAILSWLVAFEVVNLRNRFVYRASRLLESTARPMLAPFQRWLPTPGGLDFSPIIFIVLIAGVDRILLPALFGWLESLAGGPGPTTAV
jgi:YggT family protein